MARNHKQEKSITPSLDNSRYSLNSDLISGLFVILVVSAVVMVLSIASVSLDVEEYVRSTGGHPLGGCLRHSTVVEVVPGS